MFKLAERQSRWREVKFDVKGDMDEVVPVSFDVEIRTSTVEEGKAAWVDAKADDFSDFDFFKKWILDWRKLFDPAGNPMPYTDGNLKALMGQHEPLRALSSAVFEEVTRHDLLKRKN